MKTPNQILITGVPGTGKTTLSKEFTKLGFNAFDLESIDGMFKTIDINTKKTFANFDNENINNTENSEWICDKNLLSNLINDNSDKQSFYFASMSNIDDLISLFDTVILLVLDEENLRNRLSGRVGDNFGKTKEMQDWLFTWKDWWENHMIEQGAVKVNSNQPIKNIIEEIIIISKF